ncbi:MAG TPA: HNH endonuclease signature motif containing protein [Salinimicrobium sp.]|nr:HNH endonuclease signature motif containing protein [Salinimicrobium sp.]
MPNKPKTIRPQWVPERKAFGRRTADNQKFYNSWAWRKVRKAYIDKQPLCEKCIEEDKTVAAAFVDHIQRIEDGGAKLDEANLQSLCKHCHNSKSGKEAHGYRENNNKKEGYRGENT